MINQSANRRSFLKSTSLATLGLLLTQIRTATANAAPTILLVSGWQDMNIGDIAHTPGLLHVFATFLPEVKVILWKRRKGEDADAMLRQHFPSVPLIYGKVDDERNVDSEAARSAMTEADIMVHGSGPAVVGQKHLEAWIKHTDKPFGIFGTTIEKMKDGLPEVLRKAAFVYTRETDSLKVLKKEGISGEHLAFAPDATFFMDITDDQKARKFLAEKELVTRISLGGENTVRQQEFICVIPRLRYSPSYKFKDVDWSQERIDKVERVNAATKEEDHAKLREVMIAWVRQTGHKVLVCPEMTYQVPLMDELLIDPLPADVKPHVVKRGYWMPDEAASVYAHARAVVSFECHSPIMAIAAGTPSFYLRQPTDTIKGQMYYDLGLDDWVFEIDDTMGQQIADTLMHVHQHYDQAQAKVAETNARTRSIYQDASAVVKSEMKS